MKIGEYELVTDWKNSSTGKIAKAEKDGKVFFIKKYIHIVAPSNNGSLDEMTRKRNQERFDAFVKIRTTLSKALREGIGLGGVLGVPYEEFIDGNYFIEVYEFIDNIVAYDELDQILAGLSNEQKEILLKMALGLLIRLHKSGIVHSAIELEHVPLVKSASGDYVPRLINFDYCFFEGKVPEDLGGTIDYLSPELGLCSCFDDIEERKQYESLISTKTDIFSMGLVLHYFLSGALPKAVNLSEELKEREAKGKRIYCWVALNQGCDLELSDKIQNPRYRELIDLMLQKNPEDRPTAEELLMKLKSR